MGGRVCTDVVEGEKHVEELVEKIRFVRELKLSRDYLREEANEVSRSKRRYTGRSTQMLITLFGQHIAFLR